MIFKKKNKKIACSYVYTSKTHTEISIVKSGIDWTVSDTFTVVYFVVWLIETSIGITIIGSTIPTNLDSEAFFKYFFRKFLRFCGRVLGKHEKKIVSNIRRRNQSISCIICPLAVDTVVFVIAVESHFTYQLSVRLISIYFARHFFLWYLRHVLHENGVDKMTFNGVFEIVLK